MTYRPVPLLVLDLDGTVRHGYDELGRFVNGPADVVVFPEAVTLMRRHCDAGGRIIGVTNQGGVALGHLTMSDLYAAIHETAHQTGDLFDNVGFCPHAPDGDCWCRKPSPGLVFKMTALLEDVFPAERYPRGLALMVGDWRREAHI